MKGDEILEMYNAYRMFRRVKSIDALLSYYSLIDYPKATVKTVRVMY